MSLSGVGGCGGGVFSKGSATQEKLLQSVDTHSPSLWGFQGVPPIFFLFTCPDLVVSQSGFSTEITLFFLFFLINFILFLKFTVLY